MYVFSILIHDTPIFALFFFNDTATTEIYTLSLHDALPIFKARQSATGTRLIEHVKYNPFLFARIEVSLFQGKRRGQTVFKSDRKSTRLNSSHQIISYAVFCLKKKKTTYGSLTVQCITSIAA